MQLLVIQVIWGNRGGSVEIIFFNEKKERDVRNTGQS